MSSTTVTLLPNGEVNVHEFEPNFVDGDRIAQAVGGYFEVLSCGRVVLWFDENGQQKGLNPNFNATMVGASFRGQPIAELVGPVLITGISDEDGRTMGLTHDQVERILVLTR